ncbi:MAG: glycosyltransferase family 4 protein [Acidimicrobiia bacterium]
MPTAERPLRVAYLMFRGNPHCGGQGVYTRHLTRELANLGHRVTVFSGQPYPVLDEGVELVEVPGLDLYRKDNPFRAPWPHEFRSYADVAEYAILCAAGYPEPYAFSIRARDIVRERADEFDVIHDNQCLGTGILDLVDDGLPVLATLHHPITVDRDVELAHEKNLWRRFMFRRWYGFLNMQMRVARRIPRLLTVSESSRRDIVAQMGVSDDQLHIVPVGMDPEVFVPRPDVQRVRGRIMTTASADIPMKGLTILLEALAKARTERPDAHLVVIGKLKKKKSAVPAVLDRLNLGDAVQFVSGVETSEIVRLYGEAELAVVPSLYEGFSLPAVEAMACGVPLVATTGGALPEVVGTDHETGLLVEPGDPSALAGALLEGLGDATLRERIGEAGRARVTERFTWKATAQGTAEHYRRVAAGEDRTGHGATGT